MDADPLARWYRPLEFLAFGPALERSRFAYLHRLAGARRVLILGEGDGRALERLLQIAPAAEVDVVESSGAMIALARRKIKANPRVRFRQEDALSAVLLPGHYDAVVTLYFLDCFTETGARTMVQKIAEALADGGVWLFADFSIPEGGWRRWHAAVWVWVMYRFFRITTQLGPQRLPPFQRLFGEAGMVPVALSEQRWGLIASAVLEKRQSPSK